jgi:hypothetical protein
MSEPINFNEAKAVKEQNSTLWTPLDCLRALVRDFENGEMKDVSAVYIAMVRKRADGQAETFPFYCAGGTTLEYRGVLTQHIHDICAAFNDSRR